MDTPPKNDSYWSVVEDLTIYEAAFWMHVGSDPRAHEYLCAEDGAYSDHFNNHPGGAAGVIEKCEILKSAIRIDKIKVSCNVRKNDDYDIGNTRIYKSDWLAWCREKGYVELVDLFTNDPPTESQDAGMVQTRNSSSTTNDPDSQKPWLERDPRDPEPEQPWYTPARYFARILIAEDPILLAKRDILATKVREFLGKTEIYKRGGKNSPMASTILKAFVKIHFG